jgi:hypothetical protein
MAIRVALLTSIGLVVGSTVIGQLGPVALFAAFAAAGFFAALFYKARTGQRLSMMNGARLGWISGVFGFLMSALPLGAAVSQSSFWSTITENAKSQGYPQSTIDEMAKVMHSPAGIAAVLCSVFLLFTVLPAFGGALGAKFFNRD